jgi:hypothetical protein
MAITVHKAPQRQPSFGERFARSVGPALEAGMGKYEQLQKESEEKQQKTNVGKYLEEQMKLPGTSNLPLSFQEKILQNEYSLKEKSQSLAGARAKTDAERNQNKKIIEDIEDKRQLPRGSGSAYIDDPKMFEQVTRPPKEEKKTQASQPIAPEQLDKIKTVRESQKFQRATPSQKYQMLTDSGVSRENAKAEADVFTEEFKTEKEGEERREKIKHEYHKESKDYDKELINKYKTAKREYSTIKDLEKRIDKVTPKSMANLLRGFGTVGDKLANAFLSKDQAAIQAAIPEFLEGKKEIFGVRLSDADLKIVQDKLVDIGKNPEANKTILRVMKKYAEQAMLRYRVATDIKKQNGGLRPLGFDDQVEERFEEMIEPVMMLNDQGREVEIPSFQVSQAITNYGWKLQQ